MNDSMSETHKAKLCAQWLRYCRDIGWEREALPALADLFWHHDGWKTFRGYRP